MMRWERHWWQQPDADTEVTPTIRSEPTVWVDPSLYDDTPPRRRLAHGTLPPPSCIGAYCPLEGD